MRAHAAIALDKRNHWDFVSRVTASHSMLHAADIGFVSLNDPAQFVGRHNVLKGKANSMAHEPCGAIGTDLKLALQLERAHLRVARAHHVEGDQPLVEG